MKYQKIVVVFFMLIGFVSIAQNASYKPEKEKIHDLVHTKLKVDFNFEDKTMNGEAWVTAKPHFYSKNKITLDAKAMLIHEVSMDDKKLNYFYDNLKLSIDLPRTFNRAEEFTIYIKYTAQPEKVYQKGSTAITGAKGLYFINADGTIPNKPRQIWTQGETEAASCWFPTIDSPNERCTQETHITVADNFVTLSNGDLVESKKNENKTRTDIWKQTKPHAPYLFAVAVGEFAKVTDMWHNKAVEYYVEPEYEAHAEAIFGNTPEMLSFFSDLLDYEYPWQKYSQVAVRDFMSAAMENTTASFFFAKTITPEVFLSNR